MNDTFDIAASSYDTIFTYSHIGKKQRQLVHRFLIEILPENKSLDILEINCGTGHDAIWLANMGHHVIATDISSEMITKAKSKTIENPDQLTFRKLDINDLEKTTFEHSFDLIFSDFGGLNCLSPDEMKTFFAAASKKLKPNGKIIGVLMPKNCILENLYFILKGSFRKAFRRNTNIAIPVNVEGTDIDTWYYNPKQITQFASQNFTFQKTRPIGIFIPPSYLETFFKNKLWLLNFLNFFDRIFSKVKLLSKYSDHYIISLKKL